MGTDTFQKTSIKRANEYDAPPCSSLSLQIQPIMLARLWTGWANCMSPKSQPKKENKS